jgi:16S rRNA (cytosine967-C5)-methyltransferase
MDINRKTAFFILTDVESKKAYSNIAANKYIKKLSPPNQPFVRELAYGTLRRKLYLDYIIGNFVRTPIAKTGLHELTLLRMGLYQIVFMDSVPDYAAVDECVQLASMYAKGREGFVNGVLRQFLRDKEYVELPDRKEDEIRYLSLKHSYLPWIVETIRKDYGADRVESILEAGNRPPLLNIRANTLITSRDDLNRRLTKRGVYVENSENYDNMLRVKGDMLLGGRFYHSGLYSPQGEASVAAVKALDPQPGETIVDVCAAPGGKTMAIGEAMGNIGSIYALDIYKRKLFKINEEAQRLGITNINSWSWDSTRPDPDLVGKADRVLADVPCSGLGIVRKKPEIKYKEWDIDMELLPRKQKDILRASASYVKPGGVLLYCTCTILRRENNEVIKAFLRNNKDFSVEYVKQLLPDTDDTDGFFICKLRRKESLV